MSFENSPYSLFPRGRSSPGGKPTEFNPLEPQLAFSVPRLVSPTSAWVQHIPFALALVELLRPAQIVELGVYVGDSYCAFCQAVDLLKLQCACTGIDTWKGDAHSGFYDETVLTTLRAHHDPLYLQFSRLMRTTFDEALHSFADGSIDLLHLDGVHNYETARQDFDKWLPKISAAGVMVIHDTTLRGVHVGVHQLWEELRARYSHFEFTHGYGLGVLLVGKETPPRLLDFIAAANRSPVGIGQFFAALGQRIEFARGLSLLTDDLLQHQTQANNWRTAAQQPPHRLLTHATSVAELLNAKPTESKESIDVAHETALNLLADFPAVTADNAHLRTACDSLRQQLNETIALRHTDRQQIAKDAELSRIVDELRADNRRLRRDFEKVRRKIQILSLRRSLARFLASLPAFHRILR